MGTFTFPLIKLQMFFLIFLRVTAIMMSIPVFDSKTIPVVFKAGLAFSISIMLFPLIKIDEIPDFSNIITFGIGIVGEIMFGLIIGMFVRMIFAGIQLAGQLAGYQMGLAIANVLDPATSEQFPIISQIYNLIAMLIFITINAHHWFLRAIKESFTLVPPLGFHFSSSLADQLVSLSGNIFVIAVKVGAPIIVVLLLTSVAFGLIARTVPQMNVFIVAMPLKIAVGLLFLILSIPYLVIFLRQIFHDFGSSIIFIMKAM